MRIALQWLTSWLVLLVFWVGFVGERSVVEVGAGVIAAAIAATAAAVARAQGLASVSLDRALALRSLRVPFRTMSELGLILVALLRGRPHGRMKTARFSPQGPVATHAFPSWAETITPNDYVLEIDDGTALN